MNSFVYLLGYKSYMLNKTAFSFFQNTNQLLRYFTTKKDET